MLRKLIVVYNPRSSKHALVAREVLAPARKLSGWLIGKYEVKEVGLKDDAAELAKILSDGDLVIVAGGDGTATMAVNGVMRSGKDVTLGALGYGNFNDLARMLGAKRAVEYGGEYIGGVTEIVERYEAGKVREIYPLEAIVDGKHWRYAPCYLSLGLFAESTAVFDEPKVREKLKTGKKSMVFSIWTLAKWYFRNRKREFLPEGKISEVQGVLEVKTEPESESELEQAKEETVNEGAKLEVASEVELEEGKETERKAVFTVSTEGEKKEKPKRYKEGGKRNSIEKKSEAKQKKAVDAKFEREFEAVKTEKDAEEKKFKKLLKQARKQQLLEMKAGAYEKMLEAGTQTKAKLAVAGTGVRTKVLNVKLKTQDKVANFGEKARGKKREQDTPEIIIEGADVVELRKNKAKKNVACMTEKVEGKTLKRGVTDYIAVNGPTIAKMMRGGKYYRKASGFRSATVRLGSFWRLIGFMMCSILLKMPGKKTRGDVIKFKQKSDVMIQAEGEYEMLSGVRKIEVRKAERGIKVVEM